MQYLISFLEGIITFISPCLLPMLPIYISYFAGGAENTKDKRRTILHALGFIAGFTFIFLVLGAFAGSIGMLLKKYTTAVNIITGLIVILFGLNFMGVIKIGILNKTYRKETSAIPINFYTSFLFGMVFSIGWTPCVGAFLGSALMLASQQGSALKGIFMLLCYSLGLGIPFLLSALLIDSLKSTFEWIKKHYITINLICGGMLVLVGLLMMTGLMGYFLSILTF